MQGRAKPARPAASVFAARKPLGAHGPRSSGEATASTTRKLWLLLELVRTRRVTYAAFHDANRRDFRTFQRDLQQLRALGSRMGFRISTIQEKSFVELLELKSPPRLLDGETPVLQLLAGVVTALGEPLSNELRKLVPALEPGDPFVVFAVPQLLDGTRVHQIYERLKGAHRAADGSQSQVRFKYRDAKAGASMERTVEPYRILIRSGSAYLIAYDLDRRAWRTFALDRFTTLPVKCGTVLRKRQIPAAYAETGVIGFIKSDGRPQRVSVELSPRVAAAATSRKWQDAQTTEFFLDGRAVMTFTVSDPAEVIRWSLGFGAEAKVVAPESAVALARETVAALAASY